VDEINSLAVPWAILNCAYALGGLRSGLTDDDSQFVNQIMY
jgi:hypothetical protein